MQITYFFFIYQYKNEKYFIFLSKSFKTKAALCKAASVKVYILQYIVLQYSFQLFFHLLLNFLCFFGCSLSEVFGLVGVDYGAA